MLEVYDYNCYESSIHMAGSKQEFQTLAVSLALMGLQTANHIVIAVITVIVWIDRQTDNDRYSPTKPGAMGP